MTTTAKPAPLIRCETGNARPVRTWFNKADLARLQEIADLHYEMFNTRASQAVLIRAGLDLLYNKFATIKRNINVA
jgi:hypothetical protein